MEYQVYNFTPGGQPIGQGGVQRSQAVYGSQRAFAPNDMPPPDVDDSDTFDGAEAAEWNPVDDLESSDPHDFPSYEVGDGAPTTDEVPDNIVGGDLDVGDVDADFDDGADGYDASDFGEIPPNIVV